MRFLKSISLLICNIITIWMINIIFVTILLRFIGVWWTSEVRNMSSKAHFFIRPHFFIGTSDLIFSVDSFLSAFHRFSFCMFMRISLRAKKTRLFVDLIWIIHSHNIVYNFYYIYSIRTHIFHYLYCGEQKTTDIVRLVSFLPHITRFGGKLIREGVQTRIIITG